MADNENENLEKALWKNPLPIVKKLLDKIAIGDVAINRLKTKETKRLFAGKWRGSWYLGDNINAFYCNKIIRVVRPSKSTIRLNYVRK